MGPRPIETLAEAETEKAVHFLPEGEKRKSEVESRYSIQNEQRRFPYEKKKKKKVSTKTR